MAWTIEKSAGGGFVIRDGAGAVRGRYRDADVMALHFACLMQDRERLAKSLQTIYDIARQHRNAEFVAIANEAKRALRLDAPLVEIPCGDAPGAGEAADAEAEVE